MTIQDYFEMLGIAIGEDAAEQEEFRVYEMSQEDEAGWGAWQTAHPEIDFEAMQDGFSCLIRWGWDMCGD